MSRPVYVYFHICTLGKRWEKIVENILTLIKNNLNPTSTFLTVLGDVAAVEKLVAKLSSNAQIIFSSINKKIYERQCLLELYKKACEEECYILYLHSKGVSPGKTTPMVDDWTNCMLYYLVEKNQHCLDLLNNDVADTVGINIEINEPVVKQRLVSPVYKSDQHHYSGNFWWARSEHLRRLPATIGPKYLDPEFWIGATTGSKMACVWHTHVNHYKTRYPRTEYENKENLIIKEV